MATGFVATINGTLLNDVLVAITPVNGIYGLADEIYGLAGNDTISGLGGSDYLYGGDGRDVLYGNDGSDALYGNAGNDRLFGGAGYDLLNGGAGDDYMDGGADGEYYNAVSYLDASAGVRVNLSLTGQQDTRGAGRDTIINVADIHGSNFNDTLIGNAFANQIRGNGGRDNLQGGAGNDHLWSGIDYLGDTLSGGDGNDRLSGSNGDDRLSGGNGNDIIRGDYGLDVMTGGAGADQFHFSQMDVIDGAVARNQITDFQIGVDKLVTNYGRVVAVSGIASAQTVMVDYTADGLGDVELQVSANGMLQTTDFLLTTWGVGVLLP